MQYDDGIWRLTKHYNAVTQNNRLVKRSHKYDVYVLDKNKEHLSWPNKDHTSIMM